MKVAVVGTGRMGAAMARRVAAGGFDLVLFNRTAARAAAVAAETGGRVVSSAREAASSAEVLVVSLADDAAVEATYTGVDGLLAGLAAGAVVCDTSTVDPHTMRDLAPLASARGATLLDTPVSGSVSVVEAGALTVMAGGEPSGLECAAPVLQTFANRIFHMGEVGAGATMKLVVNSLVYSLNIAVAESLVLAEKAGLEPTTVYDVLVSSAAGAPFVKYKQQAFLQPAETPVAFTLDLVAKDQELIHRLAEQVGARMGQGETNRRLVAEAVATGLGQQDLSAVASLLR